MELWYLISVYHLMMLYICINFKENISKGFRVIDRMPVGGVMVLVLSTLSDSVLYLFQIL